jgi:hypothetical protein
LNELFIPINANAITLCATVMMTKILSGNDDIPPYAIWSLAEFVLGILISGSCGYWLGLRSQKESEKLKARNDALANADKILHEIPQSLELFMLRVSTRDLLSDVVFRLSSQLSERKRLRLEKALNDYLALDISYSLPPTEGSPNMQIVDKEHKIMLEALRHLRDEIADA